MTRRRLAVSLFAVPSAAQAHLTSTGLGPFYDGATHLLSGADALLPVLALLLWIGLQGLPAARTALVVALPSWWLGNLAGVIIASPPWADWLAVASLIFLGIAAATDRRVPRRLSATLAAVIALALGAAQGAAFAGQSAAWRLAVGSAIALSVLTFPVLALTTKIGAATAAARVGLRVLGSWLAGAGLLWAGWLARAG